MKKTLVLGTYGDMNKILFLILFVSSYTLAAEIAPKQSRVEAHIIRIKPSEDPLVILKNFVTEKKIHSASIASAVGSLSETVIRFANQKEYSKLKGSKEVVSFSGTLGDQIKPHLHLSVSDEKGATLGGHLGEGSKVYTTLEVVLLAYPDVEFIRKPDPTYGYDELSFK